MVPQLVTWQECCADKGINIDQTPRLYSKEMNAECSVRFEQRVFTWPAAIRQIKITPVIGDQIIKGCSHLMCRKAHTVAVQAVNSGVSWLLRVWLYNLTVFYKWG